MCKICDEIHKKYHDSAEALKILHNTQRLQQERHKKLIDTIKNYAPEEAARRIEAYVYGESENT
jgi:flagellar motility protein MotE (MotC chaperone)